MKIKKQYESLLKEDFTVDIKNCDKTKTYITAFVHRTNEDNNYSFWVTTAPYTLSYFGDVGSFIFRGNISAKQPLNFFNCSANYGYWHEKLETNNGYEFDEETTQISLLQNIVDFLCLSEEQFSDKDIENCDLDKMSDLLSSLPEETFDDYSFCKKPSYDSNKKYFISTYNALVDNSYDEQDLGKFFEYWYDLFSDLEGIEYKTFTQTFLLCCDNLSRFSKIILDKADEYLAGEGKQ